jgi:hypothetical protein
MALVLCLGYLFKEMLLVIIAAERERERESALRDAKSQTFLSVLNLPQPLWPACSFSSLHENDLTIVTSMGPCKGSSLHVALV